MSLLTIIQDAAVEIGIAEPVAVVGNPDALVQRLARAAQRVASDLVNRAHWGALRDERVFTSVAGSVQPGAIPMDCALVIPETVWDRTADQLVSGPVPAAQWQSYLATAATSSARWFSVRGNTMRFFPDAVAGNTIAFEYISRNFCQSAGGVTQDRWLADSDVGRLNEEMITLGVVAQFLRTQGLPSADAAAAYEARVVAEVENDQPRSGVLSAGDIFGGPRAWPGSPAPDGGSTWFGR